MKEGTVFQATDKLGRQFIYMLDKIDNSEPMRAYKLTNITNDCKTEVESEWFNQRKIVVIA